nr:hypothetical protein [Halomonas sp. DP5Y7-2]
MGKYSLAALTPELIANYRDTRLNRIGDARMGLGLTCNSFW